MPSHSFNMLTMLIFNESGVDYAVGTTKIKDILTESHPVLIPSPLPNCQGSIYLNGSLVPLFPQQDVASNHNPKQNSGRSIILLHNVFNDRNNLIGFKADHIKGYVSIEADSVFSRQEWPSIQIPSFTSGLFSHKHKIFFIIDPALLFLSHPTPEIISNENISISQQMN